MTNNAEFNNIRKSEMIKLRKESRKKTLEKLNNVFDSFGDKSQRVKGIPESNWQI